MGRGPQRLSSDGVFSPEFELALDCCRRNFANVTSRPIGPDVNVDWTLFLLLIRFHRIEGLVWKTLSLDGVDVPFEVRAPLSQAASATAVHGLQATIECSDLLDEFERAEIPLMFLKGLTLGALAFNNPAVKSAIDIDILIDPADLGAAAQSLRRCGYRLVAPEESPADHILRAWHRGWKESVWAKPSPPMQIDLHTRTADNSRLIPGIDVHSPHQLVDIGGGIRLPTLADDHLFAYLAVHGASSAWFRLKWISDFAGLVSGRSADEIERLYRSSQRLGAGRAAGQALLLTDALFGTLEHSATLRDELRRDRATRRLLRASLRFMAGEPNEPTETRWGTLAMHWTQFLLLPGLGYKLSELKRQAARLAGR